MGIKWIPQQIRELELNGEGVYEAWHRIYFNQLFQAVKEINR